MRRDSRKSRPAALFGPFQRGNHLLDFAIAVRTASLEARDPPDVNMLESCRLQTVVEAVLELLGDPTRGLRLARLGGGGPLLAQDAHLRFVPGVAQVHLVAPALEGFAIGQDFLADAGVDVIDAAIDAAANHVVAVLVEFRTALSEPDPAFALLLAADDLVDPLPMPSQADRRNHHPRPAAAAILHLRIVIEDGLRLGLLGVARPYG